MAERSMSDKQSATGTSDAGHPLRQVTSADEPAPEGQEEELPEEDEEPPAPAPAFITTHILDQTSGRPAPNILATLTLISTRSQPSYTGITSPDSGRISAWTPTTPKTAPLDKVLPLLAVIQSQSPPGWKSVWSLRFEVEAYWRERRLEALGVKEGGATGDDGQGKEEEEEGAGQEEGVGTGDGQDKGKGKAKEEEELELGDVSFYPEVEIKFFVDPSDPRRHWHVPVLLGPYGYTTYRGS